MTLLAHLPTMFSGSSGTSSVTTFPKCQLLPISLESELPAWTVPIMNLCMLLIMSMPTLYFEANWHWVWFLIELTIFLYYLIENEVWFLWKYRLSRMGSLWSCSSKPHERYQTEIDASLDGKKDVVSPLRSRQGDQALQRLKVQPGGDQSCNGYCRVLALTSL